METKFRHHNDFIRDIFSCVICSSLMISLFCVLTSEATFFRKRHQEPEYPYLAHEEEPLPLDHHYEGECHCECPKDKFIRVEVPKTQVQYYPVTDKDLEDTYHESEGPENSVDMLPPDDEHNDEQLSDFAAEKVPEDLYREFEGFVHKLTKKIIPEADLPPQSVKGKIWCYFSCNVSSN